MSDRLKGRRYKGKIESEHLNGLLLANQSRKHSRQASGLNPLNDGETIKKSQFNQKNSQLLIIQDFAEEKGSKFKSQQNPDMIRSESNL